MPVRSAGIVLYRRDPDGVRLLLVHPGGPFWRGKDNGAWMIPKGLIEPGEDPLATALREFEEETGARPQGEPVRLCEVRQSGGKWVEAFALEGDFDPAQLKSNEFTIEYPPKSGSFRAFPEVDEARWFTLDEARTKILKSQTPIVDALEADLESLSRPSRERRGPPRSGGRVCTADSEKTLTSQAFGSGPSSPAKSGRG